MIKCQYDASYLESEGSGTDLKVNGKSTPATCLLLYLWCTMYRANLYPGTETTINPQLSLSWSLFKYGWGTWQLP